MNKTQERLLAIKHLLDRAYASLEDQFFCEAEHTEASRAVMRHAKAALKDVDLMYTIYRSQLRPTATPATTTTTTDTVKKEEEKS
jgi:hypothetical protein